MNTNNFNKSSSGVNLVLACFLDNDQATRDFEDSFHVLQYSGYRTSSILVFNGFGDKDVSSFEFTNLSNYDIDKMTAKQIFKAFYNSQYSTSIDQDLKSVDLENIKDLLISFECENLNKIKPFELLESIETYLYCDESFKDFLIQTFDKNYLIFESRGYCQGDYSEIVVPKCVIDGYINNKNSSLNTLEDFKKEFSDSTFDHLLWDLPVYARLEIEIEDNSDKFYFDEFINDRYSYNKEELLKIFNKEYKGDKKQYITEWLEDNLPEQATSAY